MKALNIDQVYSALKDNEEIVEYIIEAIITKAQKIISKGLIVERSPVFCNPEVYKSKRCAESIRKKLAKIMNREETSKGILIRLNVGFKLELRFKIETGFVVAKFNDGIIIYLSKEDAERNKKKIREFTMNPNIKGIMVTLHVYLNQGAEIKIDALQLLTAGYEYGFGKEISAILSLIKDFILGKATVEELEVRIQDIANKIFTKTGLPLYPFQTWLSESP
jgi:hypothetical protein